MTATNRAGVMRWKVTVEYHHEDGTWWADSPQMPGYTAAADDLATLQVLVREGVPLYMNTGTGTVVLNEVFPAAGTTITVLTWEGER